MGTSHDVLFLLTRNILHLYSAILKYAEIIKYDMNYSHPEVLVDTNWVQEHINVLNVRIAEVDYDPTANYILGHIPGSVLIDWKLDINHPPGKERIDQRSMYRTYAEIGYK